MKSFRLRSLRAPSLAHISACFALPLLFLLESCSSGVTTSATTTSTSSASSTTNTYAAAYQALTWASGVTVSFPSSCEMTVSASGTPPAHDAYYLTPATGAEPVVATTASGIQLAVAAYATSSLSTSVTKLAGTFNICPTKATSTTATSLGAIGIMTSGEALFNAYEATSTVALGDNVSYTFTSGGQSYTASFIDECNSHAAPGMGGSSATWHYHGNPVCWTATVDGATGPSHIIGIALDGFPIYGGRDINGKVVDPATLDSCNGITSATPEFPSGAYHYVLPITSTGAAVATKQSSLNCYAGTVSATQVAVMKKLGCNMPFLLANGNARLPDGREVSRNEAAAWLREMRKQMGGMQMASGEPSADPMPPGMTMHHSTE